MTKTTRPHDPDPQTDDDIESTDAAEYAAEVGAEKYWDTVAEDRYYDQHGRYPR